MGAQAAVGAGRPLVRPAAREGLPELAHAVSRRVTVALILAHGLGALDVFALLWWVLPLPAVDHWHQVQTANIVAFVLVPLIGSVAGTVFGKGLAARGQQWLFDGRPPTEAERRAVLRNPLVCTALNAALWLVAAAVFAAINAPVSIDLAGHVGLTILLGGLSMSALGYLLVERIERPLIALALSFGPPPASVGPGVKARLVLAWTFATGVPLLGIVLLAVHVLVIGGVTPERAAIGMLVLALAALGLGAVTSLFAAGTVSERLCAVRDALALVEAGDLGAEVRVDDGTEIGLLQSGFNRMAAGLRERERLRDLFGRQVGEDVARAALDRDDVRLGGEALDVAVLFIDLVGSTALAASQPPERVVALLNRFFAVVVAAVDAHGGWVNKFEGDGALCVFGAPVPLRDPAGAALAAARELQSRLRRELPQLRAGIGVSAGRAVAGNLGAERRFEYTVIGDPVNEAARLCQRAKRESGGLLTSRAALDRARDGEAGRWQVFGSELLRGREEPTELAAPV